jgi:DNA-binding NtrC family response regulator/tetratricopeptide (TPR) repeat protein
MLGEHRSFEGNPSQVAALMDNAVDPLVFLEAWNAFQKENHADSVTLARRCLDEMDTESLDPANLALVPDHCPVPVVRNVVILWSRNLLHMDRFEEFQVLLASAERRAMVDSADPELAAIGLAFSLKQSDYLDVVDEASRYIQKHRRQLPPAIAEYLYLRARAYGHLGETSLAREDAEAAHSVFRLQGQDHSSAKAANYLGVLASREASFEESINWYQRSLDINRRLGLNRNMGGNRLNTGVAFYKQGLFRDALVELRSAVNLMRESHAEAPICRANIAMGNVHRMLRDFTAAKPRLLRAYEDASRLQMPREEALALEFLGDLARDEGHVETARRYYSRAMAIGRTIAPDGDIVMEVFRRQGECLELMGRQSEALPVLGHALTSARRLGDRFEEGVTSRIMAQTLLGLGDLDGAIHYASESVTLLAGVQARFELAQSRMSRATIYLARLESGLADDPAGLLDLAWQDAMAALDSFLKTDVEFWILGARKMLDDLSTKRAHHSRANRSQGSVGSAVSGHHPVETNHAIVHVSACMRDLIQMTDAFADSGEPVLISGETGTGKELFARRLHEKSSRRSGNLVCVNVAAIPENLFDREFFGHVKGSFTGADGSGLGYAGQADGGTLFLDEIGELPLELQPKLLRLLQDGSYNALGDPNERKTNIRLVAATNANLRSLVEQGKFRADLYYRLRILELNLPSIADRREDILPLMGHFLALAAGGPVQLQEYFNAASCDALRQYDWPGNVREIAMVARQARVQLESRGKIRIELSTENGLVVLTGPQDAGALPMPVAEPDGLVSGRSRIILALAETEGNRAKAAKLLGVSRSTLYRHMERMGIAGKINA